MKDSLTPHEGIRIASGNGKKSPFFTFNHFLGRLLAVGSSKSFNEPSYNNAESWQFNDTIIEITGTGLNLTTEVITWIWSNPVTEESSYPFSKKIFRFSIVSHESGFIVFGGETENGITDIVARYNFDQWVEFWRIWLIDFFLKLCKICVRFTWLPKRTPVPWVATNWAFFLLLIKKKSSCIHRMSLKKRVALLHLREIRRKMLWNWNFPPYVANLFDLKTDFTLKTVRPS